MRDFAFDKVNYIMLGVGMAVVIVGFFLMSGDGTTLTEFNPDIFSARRIKVAPLVCFVGFFSIVFGIMHKPKGDAEDKVEVKAEKEEEEAEA